MFSNLKPVKQKRVHLVRISRKYLVIYIEIIDLLIFFSISYYCSTMHPWVERKFNQWVYTNQNSCTSTKKRTSKQVFFYTKTIFKIPFWKNNTQSAICFPYFHPKNVHNRRQSIINKTFLYFLPTFLNVWWFFKVLQ